MRLPTIVLIGATWMSGCTSPSPPDAMLDSAAPDVLDSGGVDIDALLDDGVDAGNLPAWPHELPPARTMGEARGWRVARAIIHSHSVHSHDACDGEPYVDGGVNEPCLQSYRRAACQTRLDVIFLTEHAGLMGEGSFERVMQLRDGDEPVMANGSLAGYRIVCADGHRVLVLPGAENELMPIALTRHPDPVGGSLPDSYRSDGVEAMARFRAAGALVAIPHLEQRDLAHVTALRPDLVEIYNMHANVDPRIAGPFLGIDVGPLVLDVARFSQASNRLEPDLVFLALFAPNTNDLGKWSALLSGGQRIPGIAGSDAHENTFRMLMPDGERGDSYRRVFRFFSNEMLVQGEVTRDSALAALRAGRVFVAFEAFGTPTGFEFTARGTDAVTVEIGGSVALSAAPVLRAARPAIHQLDPSLPVPDIRMRILRADGAMGWTEVAGGAGPLEFTPREAGVYRAEVSITPNHARPYLPRMDRLIHEVPWIYSSAIFVE